MIKEKIPLVYKVILKKMWSESDFGKLRFHSARIILHGFRMGRDNSKDVIKELKERGYIECVGPHTIKILVPIKDLV